MFRSLMIAALASLGASAAAADTFDVFDQAGAAVKLDTAKVETCRMIFDSNGDAFEICRLQKIELRPPQSNRARPGQNAGTGQANVIYTKVTQ